VIIWAHNSHIGDYRATDMTVRGEVNLGGLAREIFGDKHVALVGFGTHSGTVLASEAWNGVPEIFSLPQGKAGSLEDAYHQLSKELSSKNLMTIFKSDAKDYELSIPRGHRAVGVVYDPAGDYRRNYVPTSLNNRYDAFLFFDETHSLSPLGAEFSHHKFPETYPFGNRV
jgi:erythromycin esterase-like protein